MDTILLYGRIGWDHIITWEAYDHFLFLTVLAIGLPKKELRYWIYASLSFTIGHSLSLFFMVLGWPILDSRWVEFLIPCSIALSAILQLRVESKYHWLKDSLILLLFGCIHGMGFGGDMLQLLGNTSEVCLPLLGFNVGIEIAQLCVLGGYMLIFLGLTRISSTVEQVSSSFFIKIIPLFLLFLWACYLSYIAFPS